MTTQRAFKGLVQRHMIEVLFKTRKSQLFSDSVCTNEALKEVVICPTCDTENCVKSTKKLGSFCVLFMVRLETCSLSFLTYRTLALSFV